MGWEAEAVVLQRERLVGGRRGISGERYWERVERKRKSWGSSDRSVSAASGWRREVEFSSRSAIVWEWCWVYERMAR